MVDTFSVITTTANELHVNVHNAKKRMPTMLKDDIAYDWMFGKLSKDDIMILRKFNIRIKKCQPGQSLRIFKIN